MGVRERERRYLQDLGTRLHTGIQRKREGERTRERERERERERRHLIFKEFDFTREFREK